MNLPHGFFQDFLLSEPAVCKNLIAIINTSKKIAGATDLEGKAKD
jgi:hypothetical protein